MQTWTRITYNKEAFQQRPCVLTNRRIVHGLSELGDDIWTDQCCINLGNDPIPSGPVGVSFRRRAKTIREIKKNPLTKVKGCSKIRYNQDYNFKSVTDPSFWSFQVMADYDHFRSNNYHPYAFRTWEHNERHTISLRGNTKNAPVIIFSYHGCGIGLIATPPSCCVALWGW